VEGKECYCHEIMEWNGMEWNGMEWNGMEYGIMESWNHGIMESYNIPYVFHHFFTCFPYLSE
jgi:hypothetical protein